MDKFQRGIRAGFLTTFALALVILVLTEHSSNALDGALASETELAAQRAEVAALGNLVPLLATAETPASADAYRVAIGSALDEVRHRQAVLLLAHPELRELEVALPGASLRFDQAFDRSLSAVESAVVSLADQSLLATSRAGEVSNAVAHLGSLDSTYASAIRDQAAIGSSTTSDLRAAGRILFAVAVVASALRLLVLGRPLVGQLRVERAQHAEIEVAQRDVQMRSLVTSRLAEGMEAVDNEAGVSAVVSRSLSRLVPSRPAEMLLSDSSMAHLSLHAKNPLQPTPGCGVLSPWSCPAVRRSGTQIFDDSEDIRACPHLVDRPGGPCSAVCVPVSFVGESMGVLHVTGEQGWTPTEFDRFALEAVAGQTAVRLGAIRSFARAEIQASTDALTGLPNRRAVEDHLSRFVSSRARGSVAILDLDHFKQLNDSFGHEAGDRALRLFAEVLRTAVRDQDLAGRWGGEEFVVLLPELSAREAKTVLDRIREELAVVCAQADCPVFTVSIGVVDTSAGTAVDALVALADECLYVAKEAGRDRVVVGPVAEMASISSSADREALA